MRSQFERPPRAGAAVRGLLLVASLGLAGCAAGPPTNTLANLFGAGGGEATTTPLPEPAAPLDPVLAFLADAETGAASSVRTASGAPVQIIAGAPYHAASGRRCRPYRLVPAGGADAVRHGLACRTDAGAWEKVDVIVNPDSLDGPSRVLPLGRRAS